MCGRKYGLWRFFLLGMRRLWVYTKVKPGRQLWLQLSLNYSDCISQIIYSLFLSVGCLSVYEYIRTSDPLPTAASRSANSYSSSWVPEIASGRTRTRVWRSGNARVCSKANSNYGNGNGLLFRMTQPISRNTIKAIACSKPTISEN